MALIAGNSRAEGRLIDWRLGPRSMFFMLWMANVLLLMGWGLGTLFVLAHTDSGLQASQREKEMLWVLAFIYFSAAVFAASFDLACKCDGGTT